MKLYVVFFCVVINLKKESFLKKGYMHMSNIWSMSAENMTWSFLAINPTHLEGGIQEGANIKHRRSGLACKMAFEDLAVTWEQFSTSMCTYELLLQKLIFNRPLPW